MFSDDEPSHPTTPIKIKQQYHTERILSTTVQTKQHKSIVEKVNYKVHTFELMNEVSLLKAKQKEYESHIETLKDTICNFEFQIGSFLKTISCKDFKDALQMIRKLYQCKNCHQSANAQNGCNLKQSTSEYKQKASLESALHEHYSQNLCKKLQNLQTESENKAQSIEAENKKLKNELTEIKLQYRQLICENTEIRENSDKVRAELKRSIDNYEHIEMQVQEKMKQYLEKIREYEQIIEGSRERQRVSPANAHSEAQKNKQEDQPYQQSHKSDFSFGNDSLSDHFPEADKQAHQKQTKSAEVDDLKLKIECYSASIEGLLDENRRLKKAFQNLHKLRRGEELSEELIKEVGIIQSIMELSDSLSCA